MCQAIPRRVLQTQGDRLLVDYDDRPTWVHGVDLPDVRAGDYVVVYAGQALERMEQAQAEELLAFYASLEDLLEEASR
ncbi:MAG: HypC/HybG/HupF family hydrogenase formation chaperone [Chloroflexota bacterium]|nr:HypC/HybG/HupF family hydrogenase formation chaperone [Chloroflexota bacterium]